MRDEALAMPGYATGAWEPTVGGDGPAYAFALHDKRFASNLKAAKAFVERVPDAELLRQKVGQTAQATARFVSRGEALPFPKQYDLPFSHVQLLVERLDVPLRTRRPTCYFVDSMSDLFHEDVPNAFLDRVFNTMELVAATRHRFLILTKRPERMCAYLAQRWRPNDLWPDGYRPAHIWIGTSAEDQRSADERIPHLLATPAAVRFLSCEPLIGPVDLNEWLWWDHTPMHLQRDPEQYPEDWSPQEDLHWVIVGGESGPRARPMDLAWARSLVAQCRAAGVAVFVKQDSGPRPGMQGRIPDELWLKEWPRG